MANIKDVAKKAGVSVATVSRYLNQKGYISTDAKNVIEIAIRELGYKRTYSIGYNESLFP